jgi:hypothetical protein
MKRYISAVLAATVIAGLTACGGGEPKAATATGSASSTASTTASATPKPTRTAKAIPDFAGKPFSEARKTLGNAGFIVSIVGQDGKKWTGGVDDTVLVVSSAPAAGTVTNTTDIAFTVNVSQEEFLAAGKAKADAAKLLARYTLTCGSYSSTQPTYTGYKAVWASPDYKGSGTCSVKIDGKASYDKVPLIPLEQPFVDLVASKGGDVSVPSSTIGKLVSLCAKLPSDYADEVVVNTAWRKAEAEAALAMCPDAPHVGLLREALTAVKIGDGNHTVGQNMEPGTYRTKPGIEDCYWSRNTGGGNIIANDFVGFAPNGVTVTVYGGEGFESTRCGVWTKIG